MYLFLGNESTEESTISGQDKSTAINHIPIHDLPTQIILSPGEGKIRTLLC